MLNERNGLHSSSRNVQMSIGNGELELLSRGRFAHVNESRDAEAEVTAELSG